MIPPLQTWTRMFAMELRPVFLIRCNFETVVVSACTSPVTRGGRFPVNISASVCIWYVIFRRMFQLVAVARISFLSRCTLWDSPRVKQLRVAVAVFSAPCGCLSVQYFSDPRCVWLVCSTFKGDLSSTCTYYRCVGNSCRFLHQSRLRRSRARVCWTLVLTSFVASCTQSRCGVEGSSLQMNCRHWVGHPTCLPDDYERSLRVRDSLHTRPRPRNASWGERSRCLPRSGHACNECWPCADVSGRASALPRLFLCWRQSDRTLLGVFLC